MEFNFELNKISRASMFLKGTDDEGKPCYL